MLCHCMCIFVKLRDLGNLARKKKHKDVAMSDPEKCVRRGY